MVSIHQDVNDKYEIPTITDNTKHFIDILEPSVEDKYFVTNPDYQDYIHKIISLSDCNIKNKTVRLGGLFDTEKSKHQAGSIWDKECISPTIDTMQGGYRQPCVMVKEGTKKGYVEAVDDDSVNLPYSNSKTRRERVGHGIAPTLTSTSASNEKIIIKSSDMNE